MLSVPRASMGSQGNSDTKMGGIGSLLNLVQRRQLPSPRCALGNPALCGAVVREQLLLAPEKKERKFNELLDMEES